jgi:hypothetical protein
VWLDCVKRGGRDTETKIHCVGDGAGWIIEQARQRSQGQADYLIDFYHVSEYLADAGSVIAGGKIKQWLEKQQSRLIDNRLAKVLEEIVPHIEESEIKDEEAAVRRCYCYLTNHREQLNY